MKVDRLELDSVETASQPESRVQSGLQVSVSGLIKRFGERQVLHGLDMEIQPGTFVAVVGRSGCGKSTLLRLLAGLETISDGSIRLDNADMAQQRGQVRIMFQDARLLPWRTVIQNVVLGLEGDPAVIRRQACEVLAEVGLADRADEWPAQLSGGQRQRVALARALIHRPRLLLLDEPLSALDALTRIEMHRLIEKVRRQHRFTVVLVTHDVAEAVALADRVVLVEQGRITLDQPVDLPYPREHATTGFVMLEKMILKRLMTVEAVNTRNQLRGRIIRIVPGRVLSEIHVLTPGGEVSATVSTRTLHDMPLEQGADVLAMFKSTEVMLATVQDIP